MKNYIFYEKQIDGPIFMREFAVNDDVTLNVQARDILHLELAQVGAKYKVVDLDSVEMSRVGDAPHNPITWVDHIEVWPHIFTDDYLIL